MTRRWARGLVVAGTLLVLAGEALTPAPRPQVLVRTRLVRVTPPPYVWVEFGGSLTASQMAEALARAGVVRSARAFLAQAGSAALRFRPGLYRFRRPEEGRRVVAQLLSGGR